MSEEFSTEVLASAPTVVAPDGSVVRPLCVLPGQGSFAHFTLPGGEVSVAVSHETVQEIWYITGGVGEMWRAQGGREETVRLLPGVCLTIPLGTTFQFRATGDEPLEMVAVTMPPWPVDSLTEARPESGRWEPYLGQLDEAAIPGSRSAGDGDARRLAGPPAQRQDGGHLSGG